MAHRDLGKRILDDAFAAYAVDVLHVVAQGRVIAVKPNRAARLLPPRQVPQHGDTMCEIIHCDGAYEVRIVVENQFDVFGRALVLPPFVHGHLCEPIFIWLVTLDRLEVLLCFC